MSRIRSKDGLEIIKSAALVVLFLITILLLYFLWEDKPFERWAQGDNLARREALRYDEILRPSLVAAHTGGGSYAMTPDAFEPMVDSLSAFSRSENVIMEEIEERLYKDGLRHPSVEARFHYYVPFAVMCEVFDIQRIAGADGIDAFSAFAYTEAYPGDLFFFDQKSNRYYRLAGDGAASLPALSAIIADAGNRVTHFTLETNFGGLIDNQTLIPYSPESDVRDFAYVGELALEEEDKAAHITRIAKSFFNDNFDFVRKIEEIGGTVIYMYGFGKIVLIIDKDGTVEFKREEAERPFTPVRYLDALDKALDFIAGHGAAEAFSENAQALHLKSVAVDLDGKRGYRFVFGFSVNGLEVFYQNSEVFEVEVIGDRVTYYKRDLILYNENQIKAAAGDFRGICSPMNVLAYNLAHISAALYEAAPVEGASPELSIEELAAQVDRLEIAYARLAGGDETDEHVVRAVWLLTIAQLEFYFALDDGAPLGYSQRQYTL